MQRLILNLLLGLSLITTVPVMSGCRRTVSEEKTSETKSDGTTETKTEKTTQSPNGSQTTTTEHNVNNP